MVTFQFVLRTETGGGEGGGIFVEYLTRAGVFF